MKKDGIPPPVFWAQNPCFLEVTDRVALQNIDNKGVPCKILQDKELRAVFATVGSFRLEDSAKWTCRDDVCWKTSENHCARKEEIICNHLRWGQTLATRSNVVRVFPVPVQYCVRLT